MEIHHEKYTLSVQKLYCLHNASSFASLLKNFSHRSSGANDGSFVKFELLTMCATWLTTVVDVDGF